MAWWATATNVTTAMASATLLPTSYDDDFVALGGSYPMWTGEGGKLAYTYLLWSAVSLLVILTVSVMHLWRVWDATTQRTGVEARLAKLQKELAKERSRVFNPAPHTWRREQTQLNLSKVCIECNEVFTEHFQRCVVCGLAAHSECAHRTLNDCKRLCLAADTVSNRAHRQRTGSAPSTPLSSAAAASAPATPSTPNNQKTTSSAAATPATPATPSSNGKRYGLLHRKQKQKAERKESARDKQAQRELLENGMTHHWVDLVKDLDGSHFSDDAECALCNDRLHTGFLGRQPVWGCLWCQAFAHAPCVASLTGSRSSLKGGLCNCGGAHANLIVPPMYIVERAPATVGTPGSSNAKASPVKTQTDVNGSSGPLDRKRSASTSDLASNSKRNSVDKGVVRRRKRGSGEGVGDKSDKSGDDAESPSAPAVGMSLTRAFSESQGLSSNHRQLEEMEARAPWPDPERYEILPLPAHLHPVLVFVNGRSGNQDGTRIARRLRRVLHPLQVVELPGPGPAAPLRMFLRVPHLRILAAGGDGTVAWVLQALDEVMAEPSFRGIPPPPTAVVPLGTGNDLARVLGWASSKGWGLESGRVQVGPVLHDVDKATVALLDRWKIEFHPTAERRRGQLQPITQPTKTRIMNNYYGVGVDAKVALDVHTMRENHPDWFLSQMGNKLWYTGLGAGETLSHSCSDLASSLVVECDGKRLELPPDIEGILILNINSFMGGVNLWQSTPEKPVPPQGLHDQLLEVVGIYGSLHMGKLQVGLAHAPCLTQCSTVRITTLDELPMQVDGEPWIMPKSTMIIRHHNQAWMLMREKEETTAEISAIMKEVLDDCEMQQVITIDQHREIIGKLAKRLHR